MANTRKSTAIARRNGRAKWDQLVALVVDSVNSPASKRAYSTSLDKFFEWYYEEPRPPFSKAVVNSYKVHLLSRSLSPSTINISLAAIRALAREGTDNAMLDPVLGQAIMRLRGVPSLGVKLGRWLGKKEAEALLRQPDQSRLRGQRDFALLCVLVGCGLRRAECCTLTFEHVAQIESRWIIRNLVGKGGRIRSVAMPAWCHAAITQWTAAAGLADGWIFQTLLKGRGVTGRPLDPALLFDLVRHYAAKAGIEKLACHDLRRTHALLAYHGGSPLDQIQKALGHASIMTTERYLQIEQNWHDAPADRLQLRVRVGS